MSQGFISNYLITGIYVTGFHFIFFYFFPIQISLKGMATLYKKNRCPILNYIKHASSAPPPSKLHTHLICMIDTYYVCHIYDI